MIFVVLFRGDRELRLEGETLLHSGEGAGSVIIIRDARQLYVAAIPSDIVAAVYAESIVKGQS